MQALSEGRLKPCLIPLVLILMTNISNADSNEIHLIYQPYAQLLADFVVEHDLADQGLITSFDYRAALNHPDTTERLESQRRRLANFNTDALTKRNSTIAFWINAYNFFMIVHILENLQDGALISSVRDYGILFNPYRVFRRDLFTIGNRKYSLSEIENDILLGESFNRKGWKDARVHFAVNCASVGCPPLRREPYTGDNIERLLEENTRRALNTPIHLNFKNDILYLTRLFDWYSADFVESAGSVRGFVTEKADESLRPRIEATRDIRFIDYDWNLNSPENLQPWIE